MLQMTKILSLAGACALTFCLSGQAQEKMLVGLITKDNTHPAFAKLVETAEKRAPELGVELQSFDGDHERQVKTVETLVQAGAKGIMIASSDPAGIVPTLRKAREAGVFVIAVDIETVPMDAVDATFQTDQILAGELIGRFARATLGDAASEAKIGFINLVESQPAFDWQRNQGFMKGFGIDVKDPERYGDEDDPRIVGQQWGGGSEEGGRQAMEKLLETAPDINLVYAINESSAAGAAQALKQAGRDDVLLVSIDGSCTGVRNVASGAFGATSLQYLSVMSVLGLEAIIKYYETGEIPQKSEGLEFFNTGATLVTDKPVDGVQSISTEEALQQCWG